MTESLEVTGPTVEAAIGEALERLDARREDVDVEVLSEDVSAGQASIRVSRRAAEAGDATPEASGDGDILDDQADAAEDFLNGLLDVLDMDGEAEAEIEDDHIYVEMSGPGMGLLIGRHGATLDSLQDLTRAAVLRTTGEFPSLTLDIEGYRERHEEILVRKARSVARRVSESGQAESLEPMNASDRKVVHNALADFDGVATGSEGNEPERYVVISPAH